MIPSINRAVTHTPSNTTSLVSTVAHATLFAVIFAVGCGIGLFHASSTLRTDSQATQPNQRHQAIASSGGATPAMSDLWKQLEAVDVVIGDVRSSLVTLSESAASAETQQDSSTQQQPDPVYDVAWQQTGAGIQQMHDIVDHMQFALGSAQPSPTPSPSAFPASVSASVSVSMAATPSASAVGLPTKPEERLAIFATLVKAGVHYRGWSLVRNAMRLKCSLDKMGNTLPFHLIYGGGLTKAERALLESYGIIFEDHSSETDVAFMKSIWQPVFDRPQAVRENRIFVEQSVQARQDGWATYFKYFAWNHTEFDRILHVDLDICFYENPESVVRSFKDYEIFSASSELYFRKYLGLNTHLMYLRPSREMFDLITDYAKNGRYIPYTQGEQDVLEFLFPPHYFANPSLENRLAHDTPVCHQFNWLRNPGVSNEDSCYDFDGLDSEFIKKPARDCKALWDRCIVRTETSLHV